MAVLKLVFKYCHRLGFILSKNHTFVLGLLFYSTLYLFQDIYWESKDEKNYDKSSTVTTCLIFQILKKLTVKEEVLV
jgi:hypothetical protein